MKTTTSFARAVAVTAVAAGVSASSALAVGEPRNVVPFTRAIAIERTPAVSHPVHVATGWLVSGELHNEMPFTRLATTVVRDDLALTEPAYATLPPRGESKNEVPFTNRA
jgi:hypothetical protein